MRTLSRPTFASLTLLLVPLLAGLVVAAGPGNAAHAQSPAPGARGGTWRTHACADCVIALAVTRDVAWAGTASGGVVRHDRRTGTVRQFTRDDGLGGNCVQVIEVAPDGYVWAVHLRSSQISRAETLGASRFDGRVWRSFGAADGVPFAKIGNLAAGPGGTAWVVADGQLFQFDGRRWQPAAVTAGLPGGRLLGIRIAPDGTPWVGGEQGLARLAGSRWEPVPLDGLAPTTAIVPAAITPAGIVWAMVDSGVARYNPARWPSGAHWEGDALTWPGELVGRAGARLLLSDDGTAWLVNGLHARRFDGQGWVDVDLALQRNTAIDGQGQILTVDSAGDLWLGDLTRGIARWDGAAWRETHTDIAPSSHVPFALAVAPNGHLWVGYFSFLDPGNVVNEFDGRRWIRHGPDAGLPRSDVLGVVQNAIDVDVQGRVWVGLDRVGMAWRDGAARWETKAITDVVGSAVRVFSAVGDDRGGAWFGTGAGAVHFDGQAWRVLRASDGLPQDGVYAVAVDRRGGRDVVWFGTDLGLTRWDPAAPAGQVWRTFTTADGLASDKVYDIALDPRGPDLWLVDGVGSSPGAGVTRFDSAPGGARTARFTKSDGLAADHAWGIDVDGRGNVWVATTEDQAFAGVSRWDGRRWIVYTTADGLIDDSVFAVAPDGTGRVWIATLSGISELWPDGTPGVEPTATPTPPWGSACVCAIVQDRIPPAAIAAAVANPDQIAGWRAPLDPGKPVGPFNPRRECLSLSHPAVPYHSLFNPLTWHAGCP